MFLAITVVMAIMALAFVLLPNMKSGQNKETRAIIILLAAVPLAGVLGYEIGSSKNAPLQAPPVAKEAMDAAVMSPAPDPLKMVAQLEAKLKSGSGTPEQWAMLARSYATLKRHKEAVSAYAKAAESITNDAQMYADYADALAMSKGGLDKESEALIDKALKVDPLNPKALSLKATVAFDNKDYQSAIELWEKLLTVPGLPQDWANGTRGNIEEARSLMHPESKSSPLAEAAAKDALKAQPDSPPPD